jgi:hypothetical protein
MRAGVLPMAACILLSCASGTVSALEIKLTSSAQQMPRMGERVLYRSVVRNDGEAPHRILAWISLVRVEPGQEQSVDLEDWSAQRAVEATLRPGEDLAIDWPIRLIQAGAYRVIVSAMSDGSTVVSSSPVPLSVRERPMVESARMLPIALGIPMAVAALLAWRMRGVRPEVSRRDEDPAGRG